MNVYRATIVRRYKATGSGVELIAAPFHPSVIAENVEQAIERLKDNYNNPDNKIVSIDEVKLEYKDVDAAIGWKVWKVKRNLV